ncbi:MAG: hypothetical protein HOG49_33115 [Candidatus Scalindua sp.]|nr:hypothetical protein [Candidatus Scalindua sp.]
MYNLKKQAQIKPTEKMLQDQNKFYGVSQDGDAVITDKQLKDDRKDPQGDKIGEKQLKDVRNASDSIILEKQLNVGTGSSIDTRGDKGVVLMDMPLAAARKAQKDFDKENKGNLSAENKTFWDALVAGGKKIKNNVQGSQLLSNYDSREDFNKSNPSFDKKASLLSDADAMLYHVYKQAASQSRDLTTDEQLIVNSINANKMRILADHKADIAADEDYRADQADIKGDELEEREQEEKDFEEYKRNNPNEFI